MRMLLLALLTLVFTVNGVNAEDIIDFPGTISSKIYVSIKMPDGRNLSVPVINGYLPSIHEENDNGRIIRTFSYHKKFKYNGNTPSYDNKTERPPIVGEYRTPTTPDDTAERLKEIERIREAARQGKLVPAVRETITDEFGRDVTDERQKEMEKIREAVRQGKLVPAVREIATPSETEKPKIPTPSETEKPKIATPSNSEKEIEDLRKQVAELKQELQKILELKKELEKMKEEPKVSPLPPVSPLPGEKEKKL